MKSRPLLCPSSSLGTPIREVCFARVPNSPHPTECLKRSPRHTQLITLVCLRHLMVCQSQLVWSLHSPECGLPAFWRTQRPIIFMWVDHWEVDFARDQFQKHPTDVSEFELFAPIEEVGDVGGGLDRLTSAARSAQNSLTRFRPEQPENGGRPDSTVAARR